MEAKGMGPEERRYSLDRQTNRIDSVDSDRYGK